MSKKQQPKAKPGRPKHVAEYASGETAQNTFVQAMQAILTPKKPAKKGA